jgi:hypothetical protein
MSSVQCVPLQALKLLAFIIKQNFRQHTLIFYQVLSFRMKVIAFVLATNRVLSPHKACHFHSQLLRAQNAFVYLFLLPAYYR